MASFPVALNHLLNVLNALTLFYLFLGNGAYTVLMLGSLALIVVYNRRLAYQGLGALNQSATTPPLTVIIPAFNEEAVIAETVRSAMSCRYPGLHVLVVDDGSTDSTVNRLIEAFKLTPFDLIYRPNLPAHPVTAFYANDSSPTLTVIEKQHGGKSDALNAGINFCRTPYFCSADADTILEPDSLLRLMRPILQSPVETVASAGIVRVLNGCAETEGRIQHTRLPSRWVERFQVVEYLRTFLFGRTGWDLMRATMIVSGALAVFQKQSVVQAGGFSGETVTEDMELIVRLHRWARQNRRKIHMAFTTDPVCWTECPSSFRSLARQRRRWQLGLCQTLWKNSEMLFNPRYGAVGMMSFPFYVYIEGLGAVVESLGYLTVPIAYALHLVIPTLYIPLLILSLGYASFLSTGAVLLEELTYRRYPRLKDLGILLLAALVENFGYRQIVLLFRIEGVGRFLAGFKQWEKITHASETRDSQVAAPVGLD